MSLPSLPIVIVSAILDWIPKHAIDECLLKQTCFRIKWILVHHMGRQRPLIDLRLMFNHDLSIVAHRLPRITIQSVRHNLRMMSLKSGNLKTHKWIRASNQDELERDVTLNEVVAPIQYGHLECLKYILRLYSGGLTQSLFNQILCQACVYGQMDIINFSVSMKANVRINSNTPILNASTYGHLQVVKLLVSLGASILDEQNDSLQAACQGGHLEVVQYLHSIGADIHAHGEMPLKLACQGGHLEVVKFLHSVEADIRSAQERCVILACEEGHLPVVQYLYSHGVDIIAQSHNAIQLASRRGHLDIVKFIHSLDPTTGSICFVEASGAGHLEFVKFLYDCGVDIHANEDLPIRTACYAGRLEVVKFLHAKGAYIHALNDEALVHARLRNNPKIVQFIESLDSSL